MKLAILCVFLAYAAAGPVLNGPVVVSTPDQKKSDFLDQNSYGLYSWKLYGQQSLPQYGRQYRPYNEQYLKQGSSYEVPQYIVYELYQAQQNGYTTSQVEEYFLKQGYPQYVALYFAQQYDAFRNQPLGSTPYQTFQYYYEQDIPQEVQQYIVKQIAQAYQYYLQYVSKNGQYIWEQGYPYPQAISQYVVEQVRYNGQNGWSYNYAYKQLQQALQYTQNVLQYLEGNNVPQEVYLNIFKQLQQGQQYIQNALRIYQTYLPYQEYQVPYYVSQYFFLQVQEAYQYFNNVYQYIQQQQIQGTWPQSIQYVLQQVQYAYQAVHDAYQVYQQNYLGLNYSQPISQIQQYIRNVLQYIEAQPNIPSDSIAIQKLTQVFEIYETVLKYLQQGRLPQPMVQSIWQQIQEANQYLLSAYELAQQDGYQYIIQQLQYALQITRYLQYFGQFGSQQEYNSQYQPLKSGKYYEQYYPSYGQGNVWSWIQKYFYKNSYSKYQGQYQGSPYTQYYERDYPSYNKYQGQHQSLPYTQYYQHNYPSYTKDFDQSLVQKYVTRDTSYPSYYKYEEQYQPFPYTEYSAYGPYSSAYPYGPYQSGFYGNQSYRPYQYGVYRQGQYPYSYQTLGGYSQVAAPAA